MAPNTPREEPLVLAPALGGLDLRRAEGLLVERQAQGLRHPGADVPAPEPYDSKRVTTGLAVEPVPLRWDRSVGHASSCA